MIVLWGILYTTVHNINYNIVPSSVHIKHHLDKNTNYGIDIWDIIFQTKYNNDPTDIENINHYTINLFICTACVILYLWWRTPNNITMNSVLVPTTDGI